VPIDVEGLLEALARRLGQEWMRQLYRRMKPNYGNEETGTPGEANGE
jgi:hypothetical protein